MTAPQVWRGCYGGIARTLETIHSGVGEQRNRHYSYLYRRLSAPLLFVSKLQSLSGFSAATSVCV